jgi:hypothetical protein
MDMKRVIQHRQPHFTIRHPKPRFRKKEEKQEKRHKELTIGESFYKRRFIDEQVLITKRDIIWLNPKYFKKVLKYRKLFREMLAVISHEYIHLYITKEVGFVTSSKFDVVCWKPNEFPKTTNGID